MIGKRRSPSKMTPACCPPIAAPMTSCTVAEIQPQSRDRVLVDLDVEDGQARDLLDLHVGRAGDPRRIAAIWFAAFSITSKFSPNTLTAMSPRTPARSSLKRSWIGCVNS